MKRLLFLLFLILMAASFLYSYENNPVFKSNVDQWLKKLTKDSNDISQADSLNIEQPAKKQQARPRIPKQLKAGKFDALDRYARNTPEKNARSIPSLAAYLNKRADSEMEKARLAFTWVATHIHYDDEGYNSGSYKERGDSAESVLARRNAVCSGYSALFEKLAATMGLEAVSISGYSKGYSFTPNQKFTDTNHAWNAVKIDGEWKLIDATWGNGYGITKNNQLKSIDRFNDVWFCMKPSAFLLTHLPEEEKWQFIPNPITLAQYESLPKVSSLYVSLGLDSDVYLDLLLSGKLNELVKLYPIELPVYQIEMPIQPMLEKGQEYTFIFQSDYAEKIMLIDGEQWIPFKKEKDRFSIIYKPGSDRLKIGVKFNVFDSWYHTIAEYKIGEVGV